MMQFYKKIHDDIHKLTDDEINHTFMNLSNYSSDRELNELILDFATYMGLELFYICIK